MATTFTFQEQNFTTTSSGGSGFGYLHDQTIYTVPTGKIAKVKFDSLHVTNTGNCSIGGVHFICYTRATNMARKHVYGKWDDNSSNTFTCHLYNPADYQGSHTPGYGGSGTSIYYDKTMNGQPEAWYNGNSIDATLDSGTRGVHTPNNQGYGSIVLCPETFFLPAGDVLKYNSVYYDTIGTATTYYTNIRFAIWLEDA